MEPCNSLANDPTAPTTAARGTPRRRWLRAATRLVLIAVALALALAWKPLLVGFAHLFRIDDPVPSDALVMLTGGEFDRALKAADLYRRGLAPVILIGSDSDTKTNIRDLCAAGVPAEAIQTIGEVASTYDEASRVRDYAREHALRRITAVTTAYHTARVRWVFRKVLRTVGVEVHVAASDDARFNETNWYRSVAGRRFYSREFFKIIYYRACY